VSVMQNTRIGGEMNRRNMPEIMSMRAGSSIP